MVAIDGIENTIPESTYELPEKAQEYLGKLGCEFDGVIDNSNRRFVVCRYRKPDGEALVVKSLVSPDRRLQSFLQKEGLLMSSIPDRPPFRLPKVYGLGEDYIIREFIESQPQEPSSNLSLEQVHRLAEALCAFQDTASEALETHLPDRGSTRSFLLKRLCKHLVHLWPEVISCWSAMGTIWWLWRTLPWLARDSVPCHGDLRLSNVQFADDEVVFLDLEGFRFRNHPLYDVVSLMSVDPRPLHEWGWQSSFVSYYLSLRPDAPWKVERQVVRLIQSLMAFFAVYRLNETRMAARGIKYYNSGARMGYLLRKLGYCFALRRDSCDFTSQETVCLGNLRRLLDWRDSHRIACALLSGERIPAS
jgi:hypothetical protein